MSPNLLLARSFVAEQHGIIEHTTERKVELATNQMMTHSQKRWEMLVESLDQHIDDWKCQQLFAGDIDRKHASRCALK